MELFQEWIERARLHVQQGQITEAKHLYKEILTRDPGYLDALNDLGELFRKAGDLKSAGAVYAEIVTRYPNNREGYKNFGETLQLLSAEAMKQESANPVAHVHLAHTLYQDGKLADARSHYETALKLAPDQNDAHLGLAAVLSDLGEEEEACVHRRIGFKNQPVMVHRYCGEGAPIELLILLSPDRGNVPVRHLLDNRIFRTTELVAEFYDPAQPLPPHQMIFNTIGDADFCQASLESAINLLKQTKAPIINHPSAILSTGRANNAIRLSKIPGVKTPKIAVFSRKTLAAADISHVILDHGFEFPLLLRSLGFHTGQHFVKVQSPEELRAELAKLPGEEIAVMQYLDTRRADGKVCKYRVMMIDGKIYPLHAAVSHDWKVHYFNAEMEDHPEHREEDKTFLENMPEVLGSRAMDALKGIQNALGLEYAGVDFSLSPDGEVLFFEANATMRIVPPGPEKQWAYRSAPVQRVADAARAMLLQRVQP